MGHTTDAEVCAERVHGRAEREVVLIRDENGGDAEDGGRLRTEPAVAGRERVGEGYSLVRADLAATRRRR